MRMADFRLADMQRLAGLGEEAAKAFIAGMRPEDVLKLDACFEAWAQDGQIAPQGEHWRCWLLMAGRGFGKTRAGAEWVHGLAMSASKRRIALVAGSIEEARSVMVEGASGLVLVAARNGVRLKWEAGELVWPNGSRAALHSGDSPERLKGPNFHFAWADELAKWRYAESAWANLQMGLRLGLRPRVLVTTTPRPRSLIEAIRGDEGTVETGGRTGDNVSLPPAFIDAMARAYGGTRIRRQELDGEYLGEGEGALFPRALIEAAREDAAPTAFERHGVADDDADPPSHVEWLGDDANRALSPCHFRVDRGDDLRLAWTARSRAQWAWTDGVSDETPGQFVVTLTGIGAQVFRTADDCEIILSAEEVAALGTGLVDVSVIAVRTFANSMPLLVQFDHSGS